MKKNSIIQFYLDGNSFSNSDARQIVINAFHQLRENDDSN